MNVNPAFSACAAVRKLKKQYQPPAEAQKVHQEHITAASGDTQKTYLRQFIGTIPPVLFNAFGPLKATTKVDLQKERSERVTEILKTLQNIAHASRGGEVTMGNLTLSFNDIDESNGSVNGTRKISIRKTGTEKQIFTPPVFIIRYYGQPLTWAHGFYQEVGPGIRYTQAKHANRRVRDLADFYIGNPEPVRRPRFNIQREGLQEYNGWSMWEFVSPSNNKRNCRDRGINSPMLFDATQKDGIVFLDAKNENGIYRPEGMRVWVDPGGIMPESLQDDRRFRPVRLTDQNKLTYVNVQQATKITNAKSAAFKKTVRHKQLVAAFDIERVPVRIFTTQHKDGDTGLMILNQSGLTLGYAKKNPDSIDTWHCLPSYYHQPPNEMIAAIINNASWLLDAIQLKKECGAELPKPFAKKTIYGSYVNFHMLQKPNQGADLLAIGEDDGIPYGYVEDFHGAKNIKLVVPDDENLPFVRQKQLMPYLNGTKPLAA